MTWVGKPQSSRQFRAKASFSTMAAKKDNIADKKVAAEKKPDVKKPTLLPRVRLMCPRSSVGAADSLVTTQETVPTRPYQA